MTTAESFMVALFCMTCVFAVLLSLCFIIKLFSFVLRSLLNKKTMQSLPAPVYGDQRASVEEADFSTGNLKLKDVNEPTAAMIMAIVSDESGIPLSELCFKSIKLIRQD